MKMLRILSLFAALMLLGLTRAFAAKPISRDQAVTQGMAQVVTQLDSRLFAGIAGAQATLPDKLATMKAVGGKASTLATAGYLVFDLSASYGPISTGAESQILAIPLNGTEYTVLAAAYAYLGYPSDDIDYTLTIKVPAERLNCWLFIISWKASTATIVGDVKLESADEVKLLKGVRYVN